MAEGAFESDFFKEWETLLDDDQPTMTLRKTNKEAVPTQHSSRLEGETEEQRERRLKLARECSSRRRSTETPEQREKRLVEQRTRMSHKRKMESEEERERRLKKARERESERRKSETGDKREKRLKYSREKASLRREQETQEEREKRLEASRRRATQRRGEKKLLSSATASPTTSEPQATARTAQPRSAPNRKRTTAKRSNNKSTAEKDVALIASAYDDALIKSTAVSVSESDSFAGSMVVRDVGQEELMSDVVGLSTSAQSSIPPPPQHSSSLGGDSPIPNMILTTNPFAQGASNFQPPPAIPFELHQGSHQGGHQGGHQGHQGGHQGGRQGGHQSDGRGGGGGGVGDEGLEGMGFLERRYHHHPDFSVREQQSRSYNIQAVVLRNS